jgi:pre-mRNA cleavage complex 2 protein Pcf11
MLTINKNGSPRPTLVASLYEAKTNKCGTCGRRFFANEEGKQKKARHLDWHFRTNQRMAEAAKRGQSRSWYVDERVSMVLSFFIDILDISH